MTTLNLGRVRPVYQGDWSSSATYEAMDFVRYNGSCYLAVKDVPANYIPTSQTTYWVLFAAKGDKGDQGVQGTDGVRGLQGETGPFFTPSVDASGNLSWTNDAGLDNPETVNIKGPKGDQGDPGEQGIPGNPGPAGTTDYTQLQNKPISDTSLTVSGGFADAKATGDALATKVGVTSQSFTDSQKAQARTNIGVTEVPIGSVISFIGTTVPTGYLLCNGASVSRTDYAELFAVIGTKFGSDNSSTFKLPNLHHRFLEGTTTASEVGSYVEAGLPNITGGISHLYYSTTPNKSGALYCFNNGTSRASTSVSGNTNDPVGLNFNASLSSDLYGNSETVQTASLMSFALIRAY